MHNGQFGPKPIYEAPVLGAIVGGLIGGGGTLAGILTTGGLIGAGVGALAGSYLGKSLKPAKVQSIQQTQAAATPTEQEIPQAPPAPAIPAVPATPVATPIVGGGLGAGEGPGGSPIPVDTSGPMPEPFTPGEAAPPTTEEIVKGELQKKRKGRVSTILTRPQDRTNEFDEEDEEEFERLGG